MSTPKNKPAIHTSGTPPRSRNDTRDIKRADKAYAGSALVKQEPEKKLTRAQQVDEARDMGLAAFEKMASLLSGEHVTLPLMQAAYYVIDKIWKKPIDANRKLVNEALKQHMRENTVREEDERTGEVVEVLRPLKELMLDYGGETYKAEREVQRHRMGNAPDMSDVKALADELGVEWTSLCTETISYDYSEDKTVEALCKAKKMTKDAALKYIDEKRVQKSESLSIEKV